MIRTACLALLLAAPALASPGDTAMKPKDGDSWVKVAYEVGDDGDAMSCQVLESNAPAATASKVCNVILQKWKFEKSARGETVTQYVVVRP